MSLPLLNTRRLVLEPFAAEDLDALHALWTGPDVRRYLWDGVIVTRDRASVEIQNALAAARSHELGYWTLRHSPAGAVIGDTGFRFLGPTFAGPTFLANGREIELMCVSEKNSGARGWPRRPPARHFNTSGRPHLTSAYLPRPTFPTYGQCASWNVSECSFIRKTRHSLPTC
jgi:Acetyltransferase (GNAT) domain